MRQRINPKLPVRDFAITNSKDQYRDWDAEVFRGFSTLPVSIRCQAGRSRGDGAGRGRGGCGRVHRLSNQTADPVEIIELQFGAYLGEDDIVRLGDDYGRT